ncbi:MAG TPA: hypothetical protein VJ396_02050 [Acidiferrobacterales bacterium]|nr:hypothetical protein [Acidiferrobacterales bacterium]
MSTARTGAPPPRDDNARRPAMQASNPEYVLRNYLAQLPLNLEKAVSRR